MPAAFFSRTVAVNGDDHRSRQTRFHALGLGVERLAEFHDVHAVLTQSRADGRRRVGLAGLYLQLDVSLDFLSHLLLQMRVKRPDGLPGCFRVYPNDDKTPQPRAAGCGIHCAS